MPKPDRRSARRAEARALQAARAPLSREVTDAMRLAQLPPVAAWLSEWDDASRLVIAGLARRRADGDVALVTLLVDMGCLGVKNHHLHPKVRLSEAEFLVAEVGVPITRVEPELLAAVVRAAARWSTHCGVPTNPSQQLGLAFLAGITPSTVEVPVGLEGKPFLMPGRQDDADGVMELLEERFGPDGFRYLRPVG